MLKHVGGGFLAALMLSAAPAWAGEGADLLRDSLYSGELAGGIEALTPLAQAGDQEARFGLGMLQFVTSLEGLAQALYRHGLAAPETGPLGPVLGIPVPANATPEPLDYEKFRAVLLALVDGLDTARDTLAAAGESGDYVIPIDLLRVRMDINGDGSADATEAVGGLMLALSGGAPPPGVATEQRSDARPGTEPSAPAPQAEPPPLEIGFDRADGFWLAGYSQAIAIQADFLLAHDFSEFFDAAFHRLFPRAGLLMQDYSVGEMLALDPETDSAIADMIAAIHTLNWPVVEPDRLAGLLDRAHAVTDFSRLDWEAILAETDDQLELVPSPRQTSPTGATVTEEQVTAWLATLDTVDRILEGELLLPHWRFHQGFDLKAFLEMSKRTDLVMILTGAGAIPYLKDGPIADAEDFAEANRAFGGNLLGYALWFN